MSYHSLPCRVIEGMTRGEYELLRAEIAADQLHLCVYCSRSLLPAEGQWDRLQATVDHVVSRADGGTDERDNLVAACYSCNSSKREQPLLVFLARRRWDRIAR